MDKTKWTILNLARFLKTLPPNRPLLLKNLYFRPKNNLQRSHYKECNCCVALHFRTVLKMLSLCYWLLQSCTGSCVRIRPPKQSHSAIWHNTDLVSHISSCSRAKNKFDFHLVLRASVSHIFLACGHFLLVLAENICRGWLTWILAHWASKL